MPDYARLEKSKKQFTEERSTQPARSSPASFAAGMGNQAMLSMLGYQDAPSVQAPPGQSLIDEFRQQFAQAQAPRPSGGTPLADAMRAKFERQFGLPMDDVRVHKDSDEPAKFDAGAYTYGTDIFIGPGQEELLNHEMTHVAQQKLGQVRPTGMERGLAVNRSPALEHSADTGAVAQTMGTATGPVVQCCGGKYIPLQNETGNPIAYLPANPKKREHICQGFHPPKRVSQEEHYQKVKGSNHRWHHFVDSDPRKDDTAWQVIQNLIYEVMAEGKESSYKKRGMKKVLIVQHPSGLLPAKTRKIVVTFSRNAPDVNKPVVSDAWVKERKDKNYFKALKMRKKSVLKHKELNKKYREKLSSTSQ